MRFFTYAWLFLKSWRDLTTLGSYSYNTIKDWSWKPAASLGRAWVSTVSWFLIRPTTLLPLGFLLKPLGTCICDLWYRRPHRLFSFRITYDYGKSVTWREEVNSWINPCSLPSGLNPKAARFQNGLPRGGVIVLLLKCFPKPHPHGIRQEAAGLKAEKWIKLYLEVPPVSYTFPLCMWSIWTGYFSGSLRMPNQILLLLRDV